MPRLVLSRSCFDEALQRMKQSETLDWCRRVQTMGGCDTSDFEKMGLPDKDIFKWIAQDVSYKCAHCGKSGGDAKLQKCSKCELVVYCSQECHEADWANHQTFCRKKALSRLPFLPPLTLTWIAWSPPEIVAAVYAPHSIMSWT
mmetsp:Transcript_95011/g.307407  ORF Transcript_95011/g.307407 Transcript_95011/m.307407 type:complete len:144 (+) Transcript_95011:106-537(+)